MGKIKLNLVSGAVVEKPLISAFKANNNNYVILDNEMNGSMGLPIILVCKLENNKLTKILDQGEWGIVKEYLKNIIAGNQIEFIKVDMEMSADDIYYTQLTLPVPSFDALKNAYKVEDNGININTSDNVNIPHPSEVINNPSIPTIDVQPTVENPINPTPVVDAAPVIENTVAPVVEVTPITPTIESAPQVEMSSPVIDMPVNPINNDIVNNVQPINNTPIEPVMPSAPVVDVQPAVEPVMTQPLSSVGPMNMETEVTSTPIVESTPITNEIVDASIEKTNPFQEQKEAFMQACENMFDALVQKFEKELENHK